MSMCVCVCVCVCVCLCVFFIVCVCPRLPVRVKSSVQFSALFQKHLQMRQGGGVTERGGQGEDRNEEQLPQQKISTAKRCSKHRYIFSGGGDGGEKGGWGVRKKKRGRAHQQGQVAGYLRFSAVQKIQTRKKFPRKKKERKKNGVLTTQVE